MKYPILALAALALASCANQAKQQALAQEKAAIASCKATYPMVVGTAHARMLCNYEAVSASGYASPALMELTSQRLIWGQQIDAGTITLDQARVLDAQMKAQLVEQQRQDAMAQQQVNAERAQAGAAIIGSMPQYQAPQYQPYLPPVPQVAPYPQAVTTNCMAFGGNQVSCTSQ